MEVRGQQPDGARAAQRRFEEARGEVLKRNRERIQQAREVLEGLSRERLDRAQTDRATAEKTDRIDLSPAAVEKAHAEDAARAEHVRELREQHDAGELNTPERIERAAQRIRRLALE